MDKQNFGKFFNFKLDKVDHYDSESIYLGKTDITDFHQFQAIVEDLKKKFPGKSYHPITNNCNHFSDAFAKLLLKGKGIPGWINRSANIGSLFSWMIPKEEIQRMSVPQEKPIEPVTSQFMEIFDKIDVDSCDCLNQKNSQMMKQMIQRKKMYLESDVDEQLILFIPFKKKVNLSSILFMAKNDGIK